MQHGQRGESKTEGGSDEIDETRLQEIPGEFFSTVGMFPKLVEVQHAFNTPQIRPSSYNAAHAAASIVLRCVPSHSSGLVTFSFFLF